MRVYFERPRTTVGWKGLINDPGLNDGFDIDRGLRIGRKLLMDLNEMGVPAGVEYLDILTPQYLSDLVSWGAIGARTTESQLHREMASGLSCPVGFKNGTDGSVKVAVDACQAECAPHRFLSLTQQRQISIFETGGNEDCHVILRGGISGTNFHAASVEVACAAMAKAGLRPQVMIDFSHANSSKQYRRQIVVGQDVGGQIAAGDRGIIGACIGCDDSLQVLRGLSDGVAKRHNRRDRTA